MIPAFAIDPPMPGRMAPTAISVLPRALWPRSCFLKYRQELTAAPPTKKKAEQTLIKGVIHLIHLQARIVPLGLCNSSISGKTGDIITKKLVRDTTGMVSAEVIWAKRRGCNR